MPTRQKLPQSDLIAAARRYAEHAHDGQIRKKSGAPYFTHVSLVAELLSQRTDDPELIAAAYLHDTIEDTDTTYDTLRERFGRNIANLVYTLTNDPSIDKKDKARYLSEKMKCMHPDALLIKLCDVLSNVLDNPSPRQLENYKTIIETVSRDIPANPLAVWTKDHRELAEKIRKTIEKAK